MFQYIIFIFEEKVIRKKYLILTGIQINKLQQTFSNTFLLN